jgi:hypothetical protein
LRSYLFIGGNQDGRNISLRLDLDTVKLPVGGRGNETYVRETFGVGDVSITIYRHASLTPQDVIEMFVTHYKAGAANRPGGR